MSSKWAPQAPDDSIGCNIPAALDDDASRHATGCSDVVVVGIEPCSDTLGHIRGDNCFVTSCASGIGCFEEACADTPRDAAAEQRDENSVDDTCYDAPAEAAEGLGGEAPTDGCLETGRAGGIVMERRTLTATGQARSTGRRTGLGRVRREPTPGRRAERPFAPPTHGTTIAPRHCRVSMGPGYIDLPGGGRRA